jgi:hypothetical protein
MGLVLFLVAGALGASDAAAQSPPAPPARFAGSVTVDGQPATPGTVIRATIAGASCGQTAVFMSGAEARYVMDVPALEPNAPNCGVQGATVTFWVGDRQANETGSWRDFDINVVNLTVSAATATPTATTPGTTTTPKPPTTGTGIVSDSSDLSAMWLFAVIGLGAVAFGAAGVVASRRSN